MSAARSQGGAAETGPRFARCRSLRTLEQFHRAVGDDDAEGGADGALDQLDVAAMGAHQLGGDGEAEAAAAGAAGALERLEQMLARLLRGRRARCRTISRIVTAPSRRPVMRICMRRPSIRRRGSPAPARRCARG